MVVLRPAMLGAGAYPDPVLPSYRGTTTGQRSSSAPGPLPHLYVTAFVQPISGEVFWRGVLVCVERGLQAVLCRAAGAVCARGRGGTGSPHRARARQCRLAHRAEPGCPGRDPARLPAPVLARASARRTPLACSG